MNYKKTHTQLPKCGLTNVNACGVKNCNSCDSATEVTTRIVQVPTDQPVIIDMRTDKEMYELGEMFVVTVVFDKPVNKFQLVAAMTAGISIYDIESEKPVDTTFKFTFIATSLGNKNISIGYKGINRIINIKAIDTQLRIRNMCAEPTTVEAGDNVMITVILSRALKPGETVPDLMVDTAGFDIISELTMLPLIENSYRATLQAKSEVGTYNIQSYYEHHSDEVFSVSVTIDDPENVEYATEEDIDTLFPELHPVTPPTEENKRVRAVEDEEDEYATEEDIDSLFPELR